MDWVPEREKERRARVFDAKPEKHKPFTWFDFYHFDGTSFANLEEGYIELYWFREDVDTTNLEAMRERRDIQAFDKWIKSLHPGSWFSIRRKVESRPPVIDVNGKNIECAVCGDLATQPFGDDYYCDYCAVIAEEEEGWGCL